MPSVSLSFYNAGSRAAWLPWVGADRWTRVVREILRLDQDLGCKQGVTAEDRSSGDARRSEQGAASDTSAEHGRAGQGRAGCFQAVPWQVPGVEKPPCSPLVP